MSLYAIWDNLFSFLVKVMTHGAWLLSGGRGGGGYGSVCGWMPTSCRPSKNLLKIQIIYIALQIFKAFFDDRVKCYTNN